MKPFSHLARIALLALGLPGAALAQGCVAEMGDTGLTFVSGGYRQQAARRLDYMALIGQRDLYNSRGVRLGNFKQVMQQDRANLHKSGQADVSGVFHDTMDSYFTTPARRGFLSTARYYTDCYMSRAESDGLKNDILNGRILGQLWVVVFAHPAGGSAVYITPVN